jgi:hypothetical protein
MALQSVERGDARPHDPKSMRPMEDAADERWEDEGGAITHLARADRLVAPAPRSHHFGEGQTSRTITQDEQDRLAGRS